MMEFTIYGLAALGVLGFLLCAFVIWAINIEDHDI